LSVLIHEDGRDNQDDYRFDGPGNFDQRQIVNRLPTNIPLYPSTSSHGRRGGTMQMGKYIIFSFAFQCININNLQDCNLYY